MDSINDTYDEEIDDYEEDLDYGDEEESSDEKEFSNKEYNLTDILDTIKQYSSTASLNGFAIPFGYQEGKSLTEVKAIRIKFGDDTQNYIASLLSSPLTQKGFCLYTTSELISNPTLAHYLEPMKAFVESRVNKKLNLVVHPSTEDDQIDYARFDSYWGDLHIFGDDAKDSYPVLNIDLKLPLHKETSQHKYASGCINATSRANFSYTQRTLKDLTYCRYLSMNLDGNNVIILNPDKLPRAWFNHHVAIGDYGRPEDYTIISEHTANIK